LRTGEVARLALGIVNLEDGSALIHKAKEDRDRRVLLSRETLGYLRQYLRRERQILAAVRLEDATASGRWPSSARVSRVTAALRLIV
jgi:integrase